LTFRDLAKGDSVRYKGKYLVDFTKMPTPISISGVKELSHGLFAIFDLRDDSTMLVSQFSDRWRVRPIAFETDSTITLHRLPEKN
jgi:hypothetical protein